MQGDLFGTQPQKQGYQPEPGPKPPLPKTGNGVRYPNGPGWTNETTSKAAAIAAIPGLNYQQGRIMEFLAERGRHGATYEEVGLGALLRLSSVCARVHELVEMGHVVVADFTRDTSLNRKAQVYVDARCLKEESK